MDPLPSLARPRTRRPPLLRWMVVVWTVMTVFAPRPGVGATYVILKDGDRRIDAQWIKCNPNGDILVITAEGKTRFRREDLKELHFDPPEHWSHSPHRPLNTNMVEFIAANPWVKHEAELAAHVVSILALQKKGVEATAFAGEVMRANEEARTNTTFQAAYWQALLAADRRDEPEELLAGDLSARVHPGRDARGPASPMFVITDPGKPMESLVVFVPAEKLRQHGITAEQYEELFRSLMDATTAVVAAAVTDVFADKKTDDESPSKREGSTLNTPLDQLAFENLLEHTRMEVWRLKPDGTHEFVEVIQACKKTPKH